MRCCRTWVSFSINKNRANFSKYVPTLVIPDPFTKCLNQHAIWVSTVHPQFSPIPIPYQENHICFRFLWAFQKGPPCPWTISLGTLTVQIDSCFKYPPGTHLTQRLSLLVTTHHKCFVTPALFISLTRQTFKLPSSTGLLISSQLIKCSFCLRFGYAHKNLANNDLIWFSNFPGSPKISANKYSIPVTLI